jgi:hypothetical protein
MNSSFVYRGAVARDKHGNRRAFLLRWGEAGLPPTGGVALVKGMGIHAHAVDSYRRPGPGHLDGELEELAHLLAQLVAAGR